MPAMQYESEYGIDVVNRFAGLEFEADDPLELIQQAQQKGKTLKAEKKQKSGKQSAKPQEKVQTITPKETVIEDVKKEGEAYFQWLMKFYLHGSLAAKGRHVLSVSTFRNIRLPSRPYFTK